MFNRLSRRSFLRAGGVALALPALDWVRRGSAAAEAARPPKRMVFICTSLGLHAPYLFPQETGRGYKPTPYLEIIDKHRERYTVFSGLSHPDQAGANGHTSEQTWLTSVRHPGLGGFRNAISVDQLAAEQIGVETRFPSLQLSTNGNGSQSYTRSGVMVPAESKPSRVFAKLFLDGTPDEIGKQVRNLRQGRSILDAVAEETKRLERRIGAADRERLDDYLSSVREMETRLSKSEEWAQKPKPKIDAQAPDDIADERDLIGRMGLLMDLIPLAVQTDSTRLITVLVQGRNDVPTVPGMTIDRFGTSTGTVTI